MKKTFLLAIAILLLPIVNAVRIEEVYYDPIGTESGGEAVVLFNPENSTKNISGWILKTETSATDVTLPSETFISAQGYFLIADNNWETNKDNPDWNLADYEEAMSLGNSDSGIELFDSAFNSIDKVGWGNVAGIEDGMYETMPASHVVSGMSLKRTQDTNDNSVDFVESTPELKSSLSSIQINSTQLGISFSLNVQDYNTIIKNVNITDDFEQEGVQILPNPGENKELTITVLATHELNYSFINLSVDSLPMQLIEEINITSAFFEARINISYNTTPDNYSLHINYEGGQEIRTYEVMSLSAIEIDSQDLSLDVKEKNKEYLLLGDKNIATVSSPTIKNIGNVELDLAIKSTGLESNSNVFDLNNVKFSFDNNFGSILSGNLTKSFEMVDLNLIPTQTNELGLSFFVPPTTTKGNYTGTIIVSAIESE